MLLEINSQLSLPIYEQLRIQIILGIASGKLLPNEGLPSVRRLAADLGINLHTVNKVYNILCDEGYLIMDRRKGAVISPSISNDENFSKKLSQSVKLLAAEAHCRDINKDEFLEICKDCYAEII